MPGHPQPTSLVGPLAAAIVAAVLGGTAAGIIGVAIANPSTPGVETPVNLSVGFPWSVAGGILGFLIVALLSARIRAFVKTRQGQTVAIILAVVVCVVLLPIPVALIFGNEGLHAFPFGFLPFPTLVFAYLFHRWRTRPTPEFTDLTPQDLQSDEFRSRLYDAAELDDLSLDRIIADELTHLRNVGVYLGGHFVGFASYATTATGSELEYIAIDPAMRGKKLGQALIASIPKPIHATTDDDAIGFYRALGFDTETTAPDPRWPDRQRYSCTLAGAREPEDSSRAQ